MTTVKDLKQKMINAVDEIDLSKLTLFDLSTVSGIVKTISETADERFDPTKCYTEAMEKITSFGRSTQDMTIADLKESE